ncbi:hypothetical protein SAMN02745126_03503 [Enhydrobacter aerosaccus]|uniref:Uncharacterized protein n=1 Tax=Enhydrobacter aerosaccus TaxID=225324 RepID=A0A1T4R360_9HYPH|nr:DUF4286 family protein [Enhydrobacter aerosaccus]SKA10058.1 hypothetical protein SAMN02745126_03503 [Enhydrobacter aerosaccus]
MALFGTGMLITLTEVKARDERDFNEWYNREHIDERVNLPGFHRARRYVALRGSPKYLATYECDSVNDLATPGYLALLANQTPWSQAVMAKFTHFHRLTLRLQIDLTHGVGGAVTAVRFVPDPARRRPLIEWLRDIALPKAIQRPGMLGAAVGENDLEIANAPVQEKSMDHPRADEVEWVVLLEGAEPAATGAAARLLFKPSALKPFGVEAAPIIGTYRLLYGNQR